LINKNRKSKNFQKYIRRAKLQRDYPEVFNYYSRNKLILANPKNTYIRKFREISVAIEKFVKEEFLNIQPTFKDVMYDIIYRTYRLLLIDGELGIIETYRNLEKEIVYRVLYKDEKEFNSSFASLMGRLLNIQQIYK
jgi:hypothetical protein